VKDRNLTRVGSRPLAQLPKGRHCSQEKELVAPLWGSERKLKTKGGGKKARLFFGNAPTSAVKTNHVMGKDLSGGVALGSW